MKIPTTTFFSAFLFLLTSLNSGNCTAQEFKISGNGFVENKGQIVDQFGRINTEVLYLYKAKGFNILLNQAGFSYEIVDLVGNQNAKVDSINGIRKSTDSVKATWQLNKIDVELIGSNPAPEIIAEGPSHYYENFYNVRNSPDGITMVRNYSTILYKDVYKNIDLEFTYDNESTSVKYSFIIHPGGDMGKIILKYHGAAIQLKNEKEPATAIIIHGEFGDIIEEIPYCYVVSEGIRKKINTGYSQDSENIIFFSFNDPEIQLSGQNLIIDPVPERVWGTYYGGTDSESGWDVVLDDSGNVYMVGTTGSSNNIATAGSYQDTISSIYSDDIFIVKFDSTGNRIWGTYFGGEDYENVPSATVDNSNNIYITGSTWSSTGISTSGSYQQYCADCLTNGQDAFIVKFNSDGYRVWGTYYGGELWDEGSEITVDMDNNIYVCGTTESDSCIASPGSQFESYGGGARDAFIVKFDSSGSRLWGTYYGGEDIDDGNGVVVDNDGSVYITGMTLSNNRISYLGFQNTIGGCNDAFLAKFNFNGSILWGTYFGGSSADYGMCLAQYQDTDLYIGGYTSSYDIATAGVQQETYAGGGYDGFIAKFNQNGTRIWSTYYGGEDDDQLYAISNDSYGNIILTGRSYSGTGIVSSNAIQDSCSTCPTWSDAVIVKFNSLGSRLWGTYYGGEYSDLGKGLASNNLSVFVSGRTGSHNNVATTGSFQENILGPSDAFLVKLSDYTASISQLLNDVEIFHIFPNPATDVIEIETNVRPYKLQVIVEDLCGRVLFKEELESYHTKLSVNCKSFSRGLYLIQILNSNGIEAYFKIIKQ